MNANIYKSTIPIWLDEEIAFNLSWAMYADTENFMEAILFDDYKETLRAYDNLSITDSKTYML